MESASGRIVSFHVGMTGDQIPASVGTTQHDLTPIYAIILRITPRFSFAL